MAFGAATIPGIVAVSLINNALYGSPFSSGYGSVEGLFSLSRVPKNLKNYLLWFIEAQTPIALAGFVAIFVPLRRWWPGIRDRRIFIVIALFVAGVWGIYAAWEVFDLWWYTRFLIASWPFLMLGLGAIAVALARHGRVARDLVTLGVIVLGLFQLRFATENHAFDIGAGHQRFVSVAQLVRQVTDPRSVVLCLDHSGSIRYYGARLTLQYRWLQGDRLDLD